MIFKSLFILLCVVYLFDNNNNGVALCSDIRIEAFDGGRNSMGIVSNFSDIHNFPAAFFVVGAGPERVVMWQPWTDPLDSHIATFIEAIASFVISLRTPIVSSDSSTVLDAPDTISVEMWNVGWTDVESTPVCQAPGDGKLCPDVIILGITQIAARSAAGEALSLDNYFAQYTYDTGNVLSDDFIRQYFYGFYLNGWYAVPLVSDARNLFFNTTTFDKLGLMYPPPYGDWSLPYSNSWTWGAFSNYSKIIQDSGIGPGFDMYGCFDEELKITMMVAQSYNVQLLYANNNTCGLRNTRFKGAVESTMYRWLHVDDSMPQDFGYTIDQLPQLETWLHTDYTALDQPVFNGKCRDQSSPLLGMAVETTSLLGQYVNSDVLMAYPPGRKGSLGGSGLMITSGSTHKDLAWNLISFFIDTQKPWVHEINLGQYTCPPYDSALNVPPWNDPEWAIPKATLQNSVPIQYPLLTFPQYKQFETIHPFRLMWMEIRLKNYSIENAIERACELIDNIFIPPCNYNIQYGGCVEFPYTSAVVKSCFVITAVLLAGALVLMVLFTINRKKKPIQNSSWRFSLIIIFGAMLAYTFVFFSFGTPTDLNCKLRIWLLVIGFVLVFGSITLKLYRVHSLFLSSLASAMKHGPLPDQRILLYLGGLVLIDVGLMFGWTFSSASSVYIDMQLIAGYGNAPYLACGSGETAFTALLFIYNALITLWGFLLCWLTRGVPSEFNEKKFMFYSLVSSLFCCTILIPVIFSFPDKFWANVLSVIGIMFATTVSLWVFCFPKLAEIYWPTKVHSLGVPSSPVHSPGEVKRPSMPDTIHDL